MVLLREWSCGKRRHGWAVHTVCEVHLCLTMAYAARVPEVLFGPVLAVSIIFTGLRDCCAVVCMFLPRSLHGNLYYHVEMKESNFIWKWFMYKAETNSRWRIRSRKMFFCIMILFAYAIKPSLPPGWSRARSHHLLPSSGSLHSAGISQMA